MRLLLICFCCIGAMAQDATAPKPKASASGSYQELRRKASFANGFEVGFSMCSYVRANECDDASLFQGITDALHAKSRLTARDMAKLSSKYKESIYNSRQGRAKGLVMSIDPELIKEGSYATGVSLIEFYVLRDSFRDELDETELLKGFKAGIAAGRRVTTEMTTRKTVIHSFNKLRAARRAAAGKKNQAEADKFLAENAKRDGVVVLPSGLQYRVLKSATDAKAVSPAAEDLIKVHYRGRLIDGTEFDSSYRRGGPSTFPLVGNVKAWTEALPKMKVGDKWELFVPPRLGYGNKAQPPYIGADSALIFEIELLGVQHRPKTK